MQVPHLLQALSISVIVAAFSEANLTQAEATNTIRREAARAPLHGFNESVVYAFPGNADPFGPLATDSKGNIYGATELGGPFHDGYIFKLSPSKNGYSESIFVKFDGSNGFFNPTAGVISDSADNIYTTAETYEGGTFYNPVVLKITPDGKVTTLYTFKNPSDGAGPSSLAVDSAGTLYGTTMDGGVIGNGTIYKLSTSGVKTILHSFGAFVGDGAFPFYGNTGSLLLRNGVLYGTTEAGGADNKGTVWSMTVGGKETILHSFAGGRSDGQQPSMGVISDDKGDLFGTTDYGGHDNKGIAYMISPSGNTTTIHNWGADGEYPNSLLLYENILYGTTYSGLQGSAYGTAFELQYTQNGYAVDILHAFGPTKGADGSVPGSALIFVNGKFYGSTEGGGKDGGGTIYELSPE